MRSIDLRQHRGRLWGARYAEFQRFPNIAPESSHSFGSDLSLLNDSDYALNAKCPLQNFVTSVKLNSRTFIAGTTMSNDSSPLARTGAPISSTFESM